MSTPGGSSGVLALLVAAVITMVFGALAMVAIGRKRLRERPGPRRLVAFAVIVVGYVALALALFNLLLAAGLKDQLDSILGAA